MGQEDATADAADRAYSPTDIDFAKSVLKKKADVCCKFQDVTIPQLHPKDIGDRFDDKWKRYHMVSMGCACSQVYIV